MAYGQTGTGKTYTIEGNQQDGILYHVFERICHYKKTNKFSYKISCQFIQIYNENIYDLLDAR